MKELRILVDEEKQDIVILDPEGVETHVKGVVIFGGDGFGGVFKCCAYGCAADAAYALAEGYAKRCLQSFYKAASLEMGKRMDPRMLMTEGDAEEIAGRWEKEGQGKPN